jgi:hypothetical protein
MKPRLSCCFVQLLRFRLRQTKLRSLGRNLTPSQVLHTLKQILMVEVWFDLRRGGQICLPRITQPEAPAQLILDRLGWSLPEQPLPRIYRHQNRFGG